MCLCVRGGKQITNLNALSWLLRICIRCITRGSIALGRPLTAVWGIAEHTCMIEYS